VSPVIWLANQLRGFDPKSPDLTALEPSALPPKPTTTCASWPARCTASPAVSKTSSSASALHRDASHELRSPLTVIKVAADVVLEDGELKPLRRDRSRASSARCATWKR